MNAVEIEQATSALAAAAEGGGGLARPHRSRWLFVSAHIYGI